MEIKIFSIPVLGGEALNEDLNAFLRSKKILQVEQQLIQDTLFWATGFSRTTFGFCKRVKCGLSEK